jgi:hypothetical protein
MESKKMKMRKSFPMESHWTNWSVVAALWLKKRDWRRNDVPDNDRSRPAEKASIGLQCGRSCTRSIPQETSEQFVFICLEERCAEEKIKNCIIQDRIQESAHK